MTYILQQYHYGLLEVGPLSSYIKKNLRVDGYNIEDNDRKINNYLEQLKKKDGFIGRLWKNKSDEFFHNLEENKYVFYKDIRDIDDEDFTLVLWEKDSATYLLEKYGCDWISFDGCYKACIIS